MPVTVIADEIAVCIDCLAMMCNGELGQGDETADMEHAEAMREAWPDGDIVPACPEDCEGWFSMSPCDGCGSHLGGDRHPATVFAR